MRLANFLLSYTILHPGWENGATYNGLSFYIN